MAFKRRRKSGFKKKKKKRSARSLRKMRLRNLAKARRARKSKTRFKRPIGSRKMNVRRKRVAVRMLRKLIKSVESL